MWSPVFSQSEPTTVTKKRTAILTPEYYTKFIGAQFFTIASIEKEFDVVPAQILNLTFFYEFEDCYIGMTSLENGVVEQMTLRLYSDKAEDFIQKAIDYGYTYVAKGKDVNIRSNTGKLLPDIYNTDVKRYKKATKNGNVYLEVATSSQYVGEYVITIFKTKKMKGCLLVLMFIALLFFGPWGWIIALVLGIILMSSLIRRERDKLMRSSFYCSYYFFFNEGVSRLVFISLSNSFLVDRYSKDISKSFNDNPKLFNNVFNCEYVIGSFRGTTA